MEIHILVLEVKSTTFSPEIQEEFPAAPMINSELQNSNIVVISVSPCIGRVDTVLIEQKTERKMSWFKLGVSLYIFS